MWVTHNVNASLQVHTKVSAYWLTMVQKEMSQKGKG
jgi:hypothetical protein